MNEPSPNSHSLVQWVEPGQLIRSLSSGQLLMVDPQRHNALIICKTFHAEFAGPGAAVGEPLDVESSSVIPIGDVALLHPQGYQERQNAYTKRLHWMRWLQQITDNPLPAQRARILLFSLEEFFSAELVKQLPDEVLARLVGVLPQTIAAARMEMMAPCSPSYSLAG
ncbi:hypothetical protein NW845_05720 [Synechococcus sp. H60.2]|uniref:hypothetical protein n=1 Tax=Synechococcus sp. H60.2 TaxID=2964518 RepID=UPI0039C39630